MNTLLKLAIIICAMSSCQQHKESDKSEARYQLSLHGTKEISLNEYTSYENYWHFADIDDSSNVYTITKLPDRNRIVFYNYEQAEHSFDIDIAKDGPDGVGEIAPSIYIHNADSIFVIRYQSNALYLVDKQGSVKDNITFEAIDGEEVFGFFAMKGYELLGNDSKLYFKRPSQYPPYESAFYELTTELVYDWSTRQASSNIAAYPDFMQKGIYYGAYAYNTFRTMNQAGELVYSFKYDPNIYIYDDEKLIKSVNIPSRHISQLPPPPAKDLSEVGLEEQIDYANPLGQFMYIVHDQYRQVYYRFLFQPSPARDAAQNIIKTCDRPFSIQIISEDFTLLGETDFPANTYLLYNYLVTPDGLLLATIHPQNPKLEEEKLSFDIFALVEK